MSAAPPHATVGPVNPARVSAVVLTLDEELHLPACLESLAWCDDVVVVDSGSTDRTPELASGLGARLFVHRFEGFGSQRNWALDHVPELGEWVLFLDADERTPAALGAEIRAAARVAPDEVAAFRLRRRFHLWGRWLRRSSLYPTWVVRLVRRGRVRYVDRGHAETQEVDGRIEALTHDLVDENLRGIEAWFARQNRYSTHEALREERELIGRAVWDDLLGLASSDPLARRACARRLASRLPLRGAWYLLYVYALRGGFLEGRNGWNLSLMRAMYEQMVAIKRHDLRRRHGEHEP